MTTFSEKIKKILSSTELDDRSAPDLIGRKGTNKVSNKKLNVLFLYMFRQIKDSGLEDAMIYIDDEFQEWWKEYWKEYEDNVKANISNDKLMELINKNFSDEELDSMISLGKLDMSNLLTDDKPNVEQAVEFSAPPKAKRRI